MLRDTMRELGFMGANKLVNAGNNGGGFTRLANTIHTRIDRICIYMPGARLIIAWQKIGPQPSSGPLYRKGHAATFLLSLA